MSKYIRIDCFACGKPLTVSMTSIGKNGRCPGCGTAVTIESPTNAAPPNSPPAGERPPRRKAAPQVVVAELAQQPEHRHEFGRDRQRLASAISIDPDKYRLVEP